MNMLNKVKQVAVLLGAGGDWGRQAIEGIMAYEHEAGPWYLKLNPMGPQTFNEIPNEWEESDGFIAAVFESDLAKKLNGLGKPVVNLADSTIDNFSAPNLRTDDRIGTRQAVDHFLERGFHNMAFAGPSHIINAVEYKKHFHTALSDENILPCSSFAYNGTDSEMLEPLKIWLHELPKPAGSRSSCLGTWLCTSDCRCLYARRNIRTAQYRHSERK